MSMIAHLAGNDYSIGDEAMYVVGQLDGSEPPPPRPSDAPYGSCASSASSSRRQ
jgi:hypothetical protein